MDHGSSTREGNVQRHPKGLGWLPNTARNHVVAWIAEFIGTFLFLFFAFSATQVANVAAAALKDEGPEPASFAVPAYTFYIAAAFGCSLAVNVWVFFRVSGGMFNPAVTFGLVLIGAVDFVRGCIVITAQIVGAIAAAGIVSVVLTGPLPVQTTLSPGTSVTQGFFIEVFATFQLIFTIFMLAAEKHKATYLAPLGIGLALFIAELAAVPFTGGSLNPARSFGPNVVLRDFASYHWVYWLGPGLGAVFAVILYKIVKFLEYETANPGQDFNDKDAEVASERQSSVGHDGTMDLESGLGGMGKHEHARRPRVSTGKPGTPTASPSKIISSVTNALYEPESSPTSTSRLQPTHDTIDGRDHNF
ncbi:aquaporin-like protein [Pseudovirgaria hyperparasitica]|uniref:Aquaporin-like protein n=1 Tax=Pseudovirgaria hyperparasitica TaxID=470096 RepID=A0A6A6W897_9PEZI|nr:aquaporin-like protein [Pseudovirgaria hyperparasitica]KAF2757301.1 aquaporin-like protein [Pseudovirgaria hyperparasitica]